MFKKLLKYDMQAVLRLWWIGAIVTPIAAVIGGIMAQLLKYANDPDTQKNIVTALITMMAGVSIFMCTHDHSILCPDNRTGLRQIL